MMFIWLFLLTCGSSLNLQIRMPGEHRARLIKLVSTWLKGTTFETGVLYFIDVHCLLHYAYWLLEHLFYLSTLPFPFLFVILSRFF